MFKYPERVVNFMINVKIGNNFLVDNNALSQISLSISSIQCIRDLGINYVHIQMSSSGMTDLVIVDDQLTLQRVHSARVTMFTNYFYSICTNPKLLGYKEIRGFTFGDIKTPIAIHDENYTKIPDYADGTKSSSFIVIKGDSYPCMTFQQLCLPKELAYDINNTFFHFFVAKSESSIDIILNTRFKLNEKYSKLKEYLDAFKNSYDQIDNIDEMETKLLTEIGYYKKLNAIRLMRKC